jgi:4'-phosphopantetheinyl transferase
MGTTKDFRNDSLSDDQFCAGMVHSMSMESHSEWLPAPPDVQLSPYEIHVWSASLDVGRPRLQSLLRTLSQDEIEKAGRFRFAKDRDRFVVGRGLLRAILGRYLNERPEQLQFCYGPYGKPALVAQLERGGIHFNVSHSQDQVLYAIAPDRRVGIDLEYVRRIPEAGDIVERYFSSHERSVFRALAPDVQLGAFFRGWTCKEAFIKATGHGFRLAPDRFDVAIAPGEPARLLNVSTDLAEVCRWSLYELLPAPGYIGALAAEGQDWHLRRWLWTGNDASRTDRRPS